MPDELTLLSASFKPMITVIVDEIVRPAVLPSEKMPWDRARANVGSWNLVAPTPAGAVSQLWTYTVPTGKMFYLGALAIGFRRRVAATTSGVFRVYVYRTGNAVLFLEMNNNVVGAGDHAELGGGLILGAGETLVASADDASTAGTIGAFASYSGFTFDA